MRKIYFIICLIVFSISIGTAEETNVPDENQADNQKNSNQPVSTKPKVNKVIKLVYADCDSIIKMLQSKIPELKVWANTRINAVEIYDSVDKVEEVEKLIADSDVSKQQVIIEMQMLEISQTKSNIVGWELSNYSLSLKTILPPEVYKLGTDKIADIFPGLFDFKGENANVRILARPKILTIDGQEAQVQIADKIPIPITTSSITSGGQVVSSTAIQFETVGIKLLVKPQVLPNEEIVIVVAGEVSSVGKTTQQGYPEIGTRNVQTVIRLKDKYTAVLGGLMKEEDRTTMTGVPVLVSIPFLGHFFGVTSTETIVTEIVLTLTPHVVKKEDEEIIKKIEPEIKEKKKNKYAELEFLNFGGAASVGKLSQKLSVGYYFGASLQMGIMDTPCLKTALDIKYMSLNGDNANLNIFPVSLSLVCFSPYSSSVQSYFKTGVGLAFANSTINSSGNSYIDPLALIGGGFNFKLSDEFNIKLDGTYHYIFKQYVPDSDAGTSLISFGLGLVYKF